MKNQKHTNALRLVETAGSFCFKAAAPLQQRSYSHPVSENIFAFSKQGNLPLNAAGGQTQKDDRVAASAMRSNLNGLVRHPELSEAVGASLSSAGEPTGPRGRWALRVKNEISNCSTLVPDIFRCAAAVKRDTI